MSPVLFASDLDSTLVYPVRTQPREQATEAAEYRDGRALTCASTELPTALAQLIAAGVDFVPVTARSRAMLDALTPFRGTRTAVTSAGGRIWLDDEPVAEWDSELRRLLGDIATWAQARAALKPLFAPEKWITGELVIDDSWFILFAPHDRLPDDAEPRARAVLEGLGWTAYGHGRKLYCLPANLRKEAAVSWLGARLEAPLVATAGTANSTSAFSDLPRWRFAPPEAAWQPRRCVRPMFE